MITHRIRTQFLLIIALIAGAAACTNATPVSTRIYSPNLGLTVPPKRNLAMAGGTAVSGTYKVKFSMGYNAGAAGAAQVAVTSGAYKVRSSSAGMIHEQ